MKADDIATSTRRYCDHMCVFVGLFVCWSAMLLVMSPKSTSPIVMKVFTDVFNHKSNTVLTFRRSRSVFRVKNSILKISAGLV